MKRDQKKIDILLCPVDCVHKKGSLPGCDSETGYMVLFLDTLYEFYIIYIYIKNGRKNYLHFCLDEPVYNSSQYRRKSVFAEAYNPEEDDGDDTKVRVNTMGERDQRG